MEPRRRRRHKASKETRVSAACESQTISSARSGRGQVIAGSRSVILLSLSASPLVLLWLATIAQNLVQGECFDLHLFRPLVNKLASARWNLYSNWAPHTPAPGPLMLSAVLLAAHTHTDVPFGFCGRLTRLFASKLLLFWGQL